MKSRVLAGLALWTLVAAVPAASAQGKAAEHWVGTWATAPVSAPSQPGAAPLVPGLTDKPTVFNNQTIRQFVHTSIGGDRARVVLSNAFGSRPLAIGGAHLALRDQGGAIAAGSDRALTFGGANSVNIPPGAMIISDPVALQVPAEKDVAVDIYLPGDTSASPSPLTMHAGARQTNYVSSTGNHLGSKELPGATAMPSWFFLSRLEVSATDRAGTFVAFGDSITDGYNSTPDTNHRWPDHLTRRLAGVSALARFDRDVLVQPGVTHVFILEGINDLGISAIFKDGPMPSVAELINGHRQLIARAHARGLKIFASTLLPYEGTVIPGYFTPEGETVRQAFNQWMRTGKEYDGIVDFDAAMRDPDHPARMLPKYDSGDHLHPNDAGYQAMAYAFDVALLGEASGK
jgi:lysophospholipase L1-like esterase